MPAVSRDTKAQQLLLKRLKREFGKERYLRKAAENETLLLQEKNRLKSGLSESNLELYHKRGCSYPLKGEFGKWQERLGRIKYRDESNPVVEGRGIKEEVLGLPPVNRRGPTAKDVELLMEGRGGGMRPF